MEQIKSHTVKDVYRISDGLLVEIHKYERIGNVWMQETKQTKGVQGCRGLRVLMEDYGDGIPKGTFVLNSVPIRVVTDPNLFKAEIKTNGSGLYGTISELGKILQTIQSILDSYKT
ncbi:hypothetical protein SIM22_03630 [Bacillus cereus group sp. BfR-BA-01363]|uniref:hypothetical protein n=1 Tax=Bacillus cereus group sp. BfR-BA-01363 TaxID=3094882 RepID=UPI0029C46C61|nr:hypothetical protein [Bacillus cereus group sp. BfR-BA-01363]MDX5853216.1 hypothetical protein [Bacillus cereus group sp. BfR-BA-01363]